MVVGVPEPTHLSQLIDARLALRGLPPLRDHLLGDLADQSWANVAAWVSRETKLPVARHVLYQWYQHDTEVVAARKAARAATRKDF